MSPTPPILQTKADKAFLPSFAFFPEPERADQRHRQQRASGRREGRGEAETVDHVTDDRRKDSAAIHSREVINAEDRRPAADRCLMNEEGFGSGHPGVDDHSKEEEQRSKRPSKRNNGEQEDGRAGDEAKYCNQPKQTALKNGKSGLRKIDDLVKSRQTDLFKNLQSTNSCTYKPKNGEF